MTDEDLQRELKSGSLWDQTRRVFSSECARIEQAEQQGTPPSMFALYRMEFEAVRKIAAVLGITLGSRST